MSLMTPNPEMDAPQGTSRELDVIAFLVLLAKNLKLIFSFGAACFLLMLVVMLRTKPEYSSSASMIIPQGNVTASMLASQIAMTTSDLLGGGFELYSDILKSRVVADRLIQNHHLMDAYKVKEMGQAEYILASKTKVETEREGLIRVTVRGTDPQRAADLANDYLKQLDDLNGKLVLNAASEERAFLEREMTNEKNRLADAEVALQEVQEKTNGLPPETQAAASVTALETARAELRAAQIRLAALLTGATPSNPEVVRLRAQIGSLTSQVESLQHGQASALNDIPTAQMPARALEYIRRKRDVAFHESLFELLEKQFEAAKEREAKSPSIVEVLDPAIPSLHKAWPPRTYFCLLAFVVGLVLGVLFVGVRAAYRAYMSNPRNAERMRELQVFVPGMRG